jgi:hypothetical protein
MAQGTDEAVDTSRRTGMAKGSNKVTLQELEERVHLAELRAKEAEADVRFLEATAKRVAMRADKRSLVKKNRTTKREKKSHKNADQPSADAKE